MRMKKILTILAVSAVSAVSCTWNYLDYNTDPYSISGEAMSRNGYNVAAALNGAASAVISTDVNTCQFTDCLLGGPMGGYYATTGRFDNTIDNYNPTNDWTRVLMVSDRIIPTLYSNLAQLRTVGDPIVDAIGKIIKVASMSRITDTYGPIPYTQIGVDGKIEVAYDSQKVVYDAMFKDLEDAIAVLYENRLGGIAASADYIYGGSPVAWCKFANSLKLRLAMRIVYADRALAQQKAEEAVAHEIGVFTSNADNARITSRSFGSAGNPIYVSVKYNEPQGCSTGGDTHVAADIILYMNGYNDPRMSAYFIESEWEGIPYVGMRRGIQIPALGTVGRKYSGVKITKTDPVQWMNAAEVAFLKAEAAAVFGFNMGAGTAKDFYEEGIRLSFDQWGVAGADAYIADAVSLPAAYVDPAGNNSYSARPTELTVAWDDAATPAQMQERIIIQKWIANFNIGNEAWADYRRTGFPHLIPATDEGNKSGGIVNSALGARRMPYPQEERTTNATNYNYAVQNLLRGTDNMATRLWWDCNPAVKE